MAEGLLSRPVQPDCDALIACIRREGTPSRVHSIELYLDAEVQDALCGRFGLADGLRTDDPFFEEKRHTALMRFLGYDCVRCKAEGLEFPVHRSSVADSAPLARAAGRSFVDEKRGPITSWEEFESYPWPDPAKISTRSLEWYEKNLPDGMCVTTGGMGHFCEYLIWLMGYETLCYALVDQRDLVAAISERLVEFYRKAMTVLLGFPRLKLIWTSDDMGFRTGTLISPDDLRAFVLPGHRMLAGLVRQSGRPLMLHSCGNLREIMEDLIEDVRIDAKHSFEDTILSVEDAKELYGARIAVLGGIDVDFLCRADEPQVRQRVRRTLERCMPGGGYCLGTGNTVTNYMPLDNYLALLDEGRRFTA
jgi:uroporphyrinogen decarboxylase